MFSLTTLSAGLVLSLTASAALCAPQPLTRPSRTENGWNPRFFDYERTTQLPVEETTPTSAQIDWRHRPPLLPANLTPPVQSPAPARPALLQGIEIVRLRFRDLSGADVPLLLARPRGRKGPLPVVIALHGLRSGKAQVIAQVAPALTKLGFAVLAPDLPLHGERPGDPATFLDRKDLALFIARAKQTILDIRQTIDLAEDRADLDTTNGVMLVGYSMGSILNSIVGPTDPRVKAMCLMVGGTVEFPAATAFVPQLAAFQPQLAIAHFNGPVLMLNGKHDPTITEEMGQRLFDAAPEPKRLVWYDSGHLLPDIAYAEAAKWLAETWGTLQQISAD